MPKNLSLEVVEESCDFKSLKDRWDNLLQTTTQSTPFLSWSWMYTWWKFYSTRDTKLHILVIKDDDEIIAIAPFYIRKIKRFLHFNNVFFLGTGEPEEMEVCSEYLDIIVSNAHKSDVCGEIISHFTEYFTKWTTIPITRILPSSTVYCELCNAAKTKNVAWQKNICGYRYYIKLPVSWEQYLATLSKSFRRKIRVVNQKSLMAGDYQVKLVEEEDELDEIFDQLSHLHTIRWTSAKKDGAFTTSEFFCFHKEVAKIFFEKDDLQLLYIRLNNDVIAILYNICSRDTVYYYQSGFDLEKYKSLSPGVLAHSKAVKNAIQNGYKYYDFMMGSDSSYKSKYKSEKASMYNLTFYNNKFLAKVLYILNRFNKTKS